MWLRNSVNTVGTCVLLHFKTNFYKSIYYISGFNTFINGNRTCSALNKPLILLEYFPERRFQWNHIVTLVRLMRILQ